MRILENLCGARTRQPPPCIRTRILTCGIIDVAWLCVDDIRLSDARATSELLRPLRCFGYPFTVHFILSGLIDEGKLIARRLAQRGCGSAKIDSSRTAGS